MTPLSSFHAKVAPWVPAAPIPVIDSALIDACIKFCDKSLAIREQLDNVTTTANIPYVSLPLTSQVKLSRLLRVAIDDAEIEHATDDDFGGYNQRSYIGVTKPSQYSLRSDGDLGLYPTPDAAYTVKVFAALKPSRSATTVDDRLFEDWGEVIAHGALAALFAMPSDWISPVHASMHEAKFVAGINAASLDALGSKARVELRVRPVWL